MGRMKRALILLGLTAGCSSSSPSDEPPVPPAPRGWLPGTVLAGSDGGPRGLLDLRGLIHAHTPYSHDACDGEPRDGADALNLPCLADFRRGLCDAAHDFVMLTDHTESFARSEFPDVLLYDAARGDELVERGGAPVASWARCESPVPEGPERFLVTAGNEAAMMAVGLDRHAAGTAEERSALYGQATPETVAAYHDAGGLVLAQHLEDWSPEQLVDIGFDGFEMYNLHANTITGAGAAFELVATMNQAPEELPHPDLTLAPILNEDPRYLERWGTVLARGHRMVTTIGTDCHQNTFPQLLPDGERVDSYRRTMVAMSNHLLVRPEVDGGWDDRHLQEALAAGRLYGVFEVYGYPEGFDARVDGTETTEMGGAVALADASRFEIVAPRLQDASPDRPSPRIEVRLLKAVEGGWELVARREGDLSHPVEEAGTFRAEVRITPRHLAPELGRFAELAERDAPWIYANAIQILP